MGRRRRIGGKSTGSMLELDGNLAFKTYVSRVDQDQDQVDEEKSRAGSGSSGGEESTASTIPCRLQDQGWKESEENSEEEEEEERRQSQSSCPSTTTSSVLVTAHGHLDSSEDVDGDIVEDESEQLGHVVSDDESDEEDSVARLRAWLEMHRR